MSPADGAVSWVVVDGGYDLHVEASLAGLRARDRSVNTERVYAGPVALFLSWCAGKGVAWAGVHVGQMLRFKRCHTLARTVVCNRKGHATIGALTPSPWLFPGGQPGRPISSARLIHFRSSS